MYFYSLGGSTDNANSSLEQTGGMITDDAQIVGARVLALLNEINALKKIDTNFFETDPIYKILLDHTVEIPDENVGRFNPFEPFYIQSAPISTSTNNRNRTR